MSGGVAHRKRLLRIAESDLRAGRIPLDGHADFFPRLPGGAPLDVVLDGLRSTVQAAVPVGEPRPAGRRPARPYLGGGDGWVKRFFDHHRIRTGDVLALERLGDRRYRLYPFENKAERDDGWRAALAEPLGPGPGPTVIELFAGCGGMALGFARAGYRTVLAAEWDASACGSLRANVTRRVANCAVQEIDGFPAADVVAGGPPCQGFSNLGERVPFDPRNQLWRHFLRAVEQARPRAFVMENVPPLLASAEFAEIRRAAGRLGYRLSGRVLNAADYGVPQTRKRAIVIGLRGERDPTFPEPTHAAPGTSSGRGPPLPPWRTVREAFSGLAGDPDGGNWHIGRNPTPMSLRRYACIPPGGNRWDLPPDLMPDCWRRKLQGGTDLFGRLWWDRPSVTIRTEFYKPEKGRYLHPERDRPITHREAARLQGFPDDFEFVGTRIEVGVQIGNACPPPLAEALARHVATLWGARARRSRR